MLTRLPGIRAFHRLGFLVLLLFAFGLACASPGDPNPPVIHSIGGDCLACFAPGNLVTNSVETDKAQLAWIDPNGATIWELEVRAGNQPFSGTPTHVATSQPWMLTGLMPATSYHVKIRAVCQNGAEKSGWTFLPLNFTTASFNPTTCGTYLKIDDDNCPAENIFYLQVTNPGGTSLGNDIALKSVDLVLSHTFLADLHISLTSPSGQTIGLWDQHGQSRNHLGNPANPACQQVCRFSSTDCQAVDPVEHTGDFIGTFLPDDDLASLDDGSDPTGIWQLRVCDDAKADTGSIRYLKLDFVNLTCPGVFDVEVGSITTTTAGLSWSISGPCDTVLVEFGPPGFQPGTGPGPGQGTLIRFPGNGPSQGSITGLQPLTPYECFIRTRCGDQVSPNTCALSFITDCDLGTPLTLEEDFDALSTCGANCFCGTDFPLNSFWTNATDGDDFDWLVRQGPATVDLQTGPFADAGGMGNYLYLETLNPNCQKGATAVLRSGCLAIPQVLSGDCQMSFEVHMWGQAMGRLDVDLSVDGGGTWTTMWTQSGNKGSQWAKHFLDFGPWAGDTVQLRFRGISGISRTSQMAIDNLRLYGITPLGEPDRPVFRDADGDGYGDPAEPFFVCSTTVPSGYVVNALDCHDDDPAIHPGAVEITCNLVDENCNGMNDDGQAPLPVIPDAHGCKGEPVLLNVSSAPFGQIYWYDLPVGGDPIHVGTTFLTPPLTQSTTYFAVDSSMLMTCASQRKPVQVTVSETPHLVAGNYPGICQGDTLDLASLPVSDLAISGAVLTYHSGFPPSPANQLNPTKVTPVSSTTYQVRALTDYGCQDVLALPVTVHPGPKVSILGDDPLALCMGRTAFLETQVTGSGLPPYTYAWSHGFNQSFAAVMAGPNPGSAGYRVTLTDSYGCQGTDSVQVLTLAGVPALTITSTGVTSCGGTNGQIQVQPSGGGTFHYAWSGPVSGSIFSQTGTLTIPNLAQGSYSLTVTHAQSGCTAAFGPLVVNGPGPVVEDIQIVDEHCVGGEDGAITLQLSGLVNGIAWSHGPTTASVGQLSPGQYAVTITGGGCSIVLQNLTVLAAQPLVIGGVVSPVRCHGESSGGVNLAISGGIFPYQYLWSNGSAAEDLSSVAAGTYQVTVTDDRDCTAESAVFTVSQPEGLQAIPTILPVPCFGDLAGSIQLAVSGGTTPYTYQWSDGPTSKDRTGIGAGVYAVTVTDAHQCQTMVLDMVVSASAALTTAWGPVVPETCKGAMNGSLSLLVSGGLSPYTYQWSTGAGGATLSGLGTGAYNCTVTDHLGCQFVAGQVAVPLSSPLNVQILSLIQPTCDHLKNGMIELSVSGGSGQYSMTWSNGSTVNPSTGLPSGNYSVTVSDLLGCTQALSGLVLQETQPLNVSLVGIHYAECGLSSSGDIDIAVYGKPPFTYQWQNGMTVQDPQHVDPGFYSVTVTDANLCQEVLAGIAVSNTGLTYKAEVIQKTDPSCFGDQDGTIFIQVLGGESPYQFNWSSGQEKDLESPVDGITDVGPGNYTVTVTDDRGCVLVYGPVTVAEPAPLDLNIPPVLIRNETCYGAKDGSITLFITGGTAPYHSFWFRDSLSYSTVQSPSNLTPGKYTLLVVDKNGCWKSLPQEIGIYGPPTLLTFQSVQVSPDDCSPAQTGALEVKMTGGVPDYTYIWSDGNMEKSRTELPPGTYCLTVEDQYHCLRDTCVEVPGGSTLVMVPTVIDECDPESDIYTNTGGGTPPYTYLWSNGSVQPDLTNIPSGTYSLTITDAEGCSLIESGVEAGYPAVGIGALFSHPADPGKPNGYAVVVPLGGTPPFTYQWDVNAGNQVTDTAFFLAPNVYCVQVTDVHNCVDTGCVEVSVQTGVEPASGGAVTLKLVPNPASAGLRIEPLGPGSPDPWTFILKDIRGVSVSCWPDRSLPTDVDVQDLPNGLYFLMGWSGKGPVQVYRLVVHRGG